METGFFWKWWTNQNENTQNDVKNLVESGQLEFISGGWSMNDEATTYYQTIIDQITWGLKFVLIFSSKQSYKKYIYKMQKTE